MSANYVQYATGASPTGLADSAVYQGGSGHVGIGTSSPNSALHVQASENTWAAQIVNAGTTDALGSSSKLVRRAQAFRC